jgi:3-oxoacyl-[acyl-carrier protein] reductase/meso-butanediol dehydrogenase/(S,S)-butanediol dehydrogenase/diacetyl reductase
MKTMVITGGSKGLGAAISEKFLQMGWRVFSGSRTPGNHDLDLHQEFVYHPTDVRNRESVREFLEFSSESQGTIDCFINNSGFSEWKALEAIDEEFLRNILETNLMGYFWGAQAAANHLAPLGSIINISSLAARRGTPNNSAYVASKFGVAGLTQSLAKELGPKEIRVNAVCPVLVKTPGLMEALAKTNSPASDSPEDFLREFAEKQTALGFLPLASDVANLCFFLAGSDARAITGQSISVDAGVFPN